MVWKPIEAVPRHILRSMRASVRNVVKALTELITNADDSYFRLERSGLRCGGVIQVSYWKRTKGRRAEVRAIAVLDFAEGIAPDEIEAIVKYGADTGGQARRGHLGQGAKAALCVMHNGQLLSVHNGDVTLVRFGIVNGSPQYETVNDRLKIAETRTKFNNRLKGGVKIPPQSNCTFAYFEIAEGQPAPRAENLARRLGLYYMLRKILADPKRSVELIDCDTGSVSKLRYVEPEGRMVLDQHFGLRYDSIEVRAELRVIEARDDLDPDLRGLLVVDEDDAVLDSTLFDYDHDPNASCLFGVVRLLGFKSLQRADSTVITDSREGLDYKHQFNRLLKEEARKRIKEVIEKIASESASKPIRVDKKLDRRIKNAFARINYLIRQEAHPSEATGETSKPVLPPISGLQFNVSEVRLEPGEVRTVYLLMDPRKVAHGVIRLTCNNPRIELDPTGDIAVPENVLGEDILRIPIDISCETSNQLGDVSAAYGDVVRAELSVLVFEQGPIKPPTGFDFVPNKIRMYKGSKRKLNLLVDTTVVAPGSAVEISSSRQEVEVLAARALVVPAGERGSICLIRVPIQGEDPCRKASVEAHAGQRTATATVDISERKPRGFFRGYELDPTKDGRQRSSFHDGTIYVHLKAPVLEFYLGANGEKLQAKSSQAAVILAETILSRVCLEWAKGRFDPQLGTKDFINEENQAEEIEAEARQIDYQYGRLIHAWIVGVVEAGIKAKTVEPRLVEVTPSQ